MLTKYEDIKISNKKDFFLEKSTNFLSLYKFSLAVKSLQPLGCYSNSSDFSIKITNKHKHFLEMINEISHPPIKFLNT